MGADTGPLWCLGRKPGKGVDPALEIQRVA